MRHAARTLAVTVTLAAALALTAAPQDAQAAAPGATSVLRSAGALVATTERPASGTFELVETIRLDGRERPGFELAVSGLDASRDETGRRAQHGAFLLPLAGDEIFLGSLAVDGKGRGRLRRRSAAGILGEAGTPLRRHEGATVEIRGPAGPVLRGTLPAFDLDDADSASDRRETYGLFVPVSSAAPQSSPGRFTFRTDERAPDDIRNRAVIQASGLPVTSTYTVYLLGPRTVVLGNMANHPNRGATLALDSRRATIPGGIVRWSEFDGGRVEVRRGATIMLRGAVAIFRAASERVADTGWARSRRTVELAATAAGGDGRALLTAAVVTKPRRREQEMRVRAFDLPPAGNPYAVATLEPDGTRHLLARFQTAGDARAGGFRVTTRRRGSTPPGGVLGQAGRTVEVTDVFGTVVLTGTFPTLD